MSAELDKLELHESLDAQRKATETLATLVARQTVILEAIAAKLGVALPEDDG